MEISIEQYGNIAVEIDPADFSDEQDPSSGTVMLVQHNETVLDAFE